MTTYKALLGDTRSDEFIAKVRAEELELACEVLPRLRERLRAPFEAQLQRAEDVAGVSVDRDAAAAVFESELRDDTLFAIRAYSEWLAMKLYGKHHATGRPLGDLEDAPDLSEALRTMAHLYDIKMDTIELVVADLWAAGAKLPFVGTLDDGKIRVDSDGVTHRVGWCFRRTQR